MEKKELDKIRRELLLRGVLLGTEFALYVIVSIFLGYFLGREISKLAAALGMVLGAFLGLVFGTYKLLRTVD